MAKANRNYKKEAAYEDRPEQVKRRVDRNAARRKAERAGSVHKGDNREVDHLGHHATGRLKNVPTHVTSRTANRRRQPPHKVKRKG